MSGWERSLKPLPHTKFRKSSISMMNAMAHIPLMHRAFGIDVPFESIHLFEYLYNKLLEMKDEIKPLGYKVAYQRPCSSRLSSDKHPYVAKIFDLIGVEAVDRTYVMRMRCAAGPRFWGRKKRGAVSTVMRYKRKI